MTTNYKDRLRSTRPVKDSSDSCSTGFEACCENPCIESKDGDNVCLNCGMIVSRNLVGNERRAYTVEEVNKRRRTEPRWREFGPEQCCQIPKLTVKDV